MNTTNPPQRVFVIKIESYEGDDTFLRCGNDRQDYLYAIIGIGDNGMAEFVDSSYRSLGEALEAWPEAKPQAAPMPK